MKKILPILLLLIANVSISQTVSMRVVKTSYSPVDPDGAGPAKGSVTIQFQLMATGGPVTGDGMGLSFVYQSALLMPTPTNTTVAEGPVASSVGWTQNVDNRIGTDVDVTYGGKNFNKRMIITYQQNAGIDNAIFPNEWTPVATLTYWTLSATAPEGGYATPEPGSYIPQNTLSSEGGEVSYDFITPGTDNPVALGSGLTPVLFTNFDSHCTNDGAMVSWTTSSESNSDHFELQHSMDGNIWTVLNTIPAAGTSSKAITYQSQDFNGGKVFYRIRQVDKDGSAMFTNIISSNCGVRIVNMNIYPVPARDNLNVVIISDKSIKTDLLIFNSAGKLVRRTNTSLLTGSNTLLLDLKGLPSGAYIIRTNNPSIDLSKSFNIIR